MKRLASLVIPNRTISENLLNNRGYKVEEFALPIPSKSQAMKAFIGDFEWQDDAAICLTSNNFTRLISPTGSGKTEIIKVSAFHYAQKGMRSLIVVPQQHIGEGFKHANIERKDGSVCQFTIISEFDFRGVSETPHANGTVNRLKRWLLQSITNTLNGRIAVSTYSSLVGAFRKMTEEEKQKALSNLWLAVDEAHHISAVFGEDEDIDDAERKILEEEGTQLGNVCEYLMKIAGNGLAVISATHFRGDGLPIFLDKAASEFATYERDFKDHWEWLGISEFCYDCTGYEKDPVDILMEYITTLEKNEHHIICVPARNKSFRKNREFWVDDLISSLKSYGFRCLDLVSEQTKKDNKDLLRCDKDKYETTGETDFDVIVACNLMREGTDWPPASRIHELAPSSSSTRTIQTIGRMLRRDSQKNDIAYNAYFQNLQHHTDNERTSPNRTIREHISDRVNVALSGLLIAEDLFKPIKCDFGTVKSKTLTEAEDEIFGKNKEAVKEIFIAKLNSAMENGKVTKGVIDENALFDCINAALPSNLDIKQIKNAKKWLEEFSKRVLKANETARTKVNPDIRIISGLDPGEIRENGFDTTQRLTGGLMLFGSKTDRDALDNLDDVIRPIQQRMNDTTRRMLETKTTNKKDTAAKRKAKKLKDKENKSFIEKIIAPNGTEGIDTWNKPSTI